jgi:hypothetical protein
MIDDDNDERLRQNIPPPPPAFAAAADGKPPPPDEREAISVRGARNIILRQYKLDFFFKYRRVGLGNLPKFGGAHQY